MTGKGLVMQDKLEELQKARTINYSTFPQLKVAMTTKNTTSSVHYSNKILPKKISTVARHASEGVFLTKYGYYQNTEAGKGRFNVKSHQ